MSNAIPKIPAVPPPAPAHVKPPAPPPASTPPGGEHHHAATSPSATTPSPPALSSADVSYVNSLMGVLPAQKMEEILLKTGIPIPAHLGPNVDLTA